MSAVFNTILILLALALLYGYSKKISYILPVMFFLLYQYLWTLMSCAYNEQGAYLPDMGATIGFTFSALRLFIFYGVFLLGTLFANSLFEARARSKTGRGGSKEQDFAISVPKQNELLILSALFVSTVLIAIVALNLIISGSVFANPDITRFNFYTEYSCISIAKYIGYLYCAISVFCGLVFFCNKSNFLRAWALLLFGVMLICIRGAGEEAGGLISNSLFFLMPFFVQLFHNLHLDVNKKKLRIALICAAVVLLAIFMTKYVAMRDITAYGASDQNSFWFRFLNAQSETWSAGDALYLANGSPDFNQLGVEMLSLFGLAPDHTYGIWYLMFQTMPSAEATRYILGNGTINAGYPLINIYIYGYFFGAIVMFFDGIVYFLFCHYFYEKLLKQQVVRATLMSLVFSSATNVITMGGIWYIGNLIPVACMITLAFIEMLDAAARKRTGSTLNVYKRSEPAGNRHRGVQNR